MINPKELEGKKLEIARSLTQLDVAFKKGLLDKKEYLDRRFEILGGRFEDDVYKRIDNEISKVKGRRKLAIRAVAIILVLAVMLPFMNIGNIMSFVIFNEDSTATLPVNQQYVTNTTEDLSFIRTDSLRVSGRVYGQGETWIYLVNGGTQRLVYYADTTGSQQLTGLVTGEPLNNTNTSVNETNSTVNQTVNETNITINQTTNITINDTNVTSNITINQTNSTVNNTNVTINQTVNQTNTSNTTQPVVPPVVIDPDDYSISTNRLTYSIGDNVSITVLPQDSTSTIYLHAPSDSYILNEMYWIAQESGDHTLSGLITKDDVTERREANFYVRTALEEETASFLNACVETCTMQESAVTLLIITKDTVLELDNITYTPTETNITNSTGNTTNATTPIVEAPAPVQEHLDPRAQLRLCLDPNPNARPRSCFPSDEWDAKFPQKKFTLVNSLGTPMATFDYQGDLNIKSNYYEFATGEPQQFDFVVKGYDGVAAWIDAMTGDLYLRGQVFENQETLMWRTRKDYVVSNPSGMYLGIFDANGNLYLRGDIVPGGNVR